MQAAAVALLQWQDTKLYELMAALLQWQVLNLLHRVKDEQICNNNNNSNTNTNTNNSNNKARCIPTELCKLSWVKNQLSLSPSPSPVSDLSQKKIASLFVIIYNSMTILKVLESVSFF
jgi:hypothetical protein